MGKGWACSWVQNILHVYPSKSRHKCRELFRRGGALGHPALPPWDVAQAWLESFKLLFFLPKEERRGGRVLEQRCDLL